MGLIIDITILLWKLKNLLSPNNLYHKDFIPVYMSIINSDLNDDISDLATK